MGGKMLRQAGMTEIRRALEQRLSSDDLRRLQLKFEEAGQLPAAAIVKIEGVELRLEKDEFDGYWTIATNETSPRLLDRFEENLIGTSMFFTLEQSVAQLRS